MLAAFTHPFIPSFKGFLLSQPERYETDIELQFSVQVMTIEIAAADFQEDNAFGYLAVQRHGHQGKSTLWRYRKEAELRRASKFSVQFTDA